MASQFIVPLTLREVATRIETVPRRVFYLPNPHAVVPILVAVDGDHVAFMIQGGIQIAPFWWLKTARLTGQATVYRAEQTRLDVSITPFSLQQVVLWVGLVGVGLILLRLRIVVGVPYMLAVLVWIAMSVSSTVGDINLLLMEMFGPAKRLKRD